MWQLEYCNDDEREQTLLGEFETADAAKDAAQRHADRYGEDGPLAWRSDLTDLPGAGVAPDGSLTTWVDGEGYFIWPT